MFRVLGFRDIGVILGPHYNSYKEKVPLIRGLHDALNPRRPPPLRVYRVNIGVI